MSSSSLCIPSYVGHQSRTYLRVPHHFCIMPQETLMLLLMSVLPSRMQTLRFTSRNTASEYEAADAVIASTHIFIVEYDNNMCSRATVVVMGSY